MHLDDFFIPERKGEIGKPRLVREEKEGGMRKFLVGSVIGFILGVLVASHSFRFLWVW